MYAPLDLTSFSTLSLATRGALSLNRAALLPAKKALSLRDAGVRSRGGEVPTPTPIPGS